MPKADSGASALGSLLDAITAEKPIPDLVCRGLQPQIALEVAVVLGAGRQERSKERTAAATAAGPAC